MKKNAEGERDRVGEQAIARLFNGMAKAARELHERIPLFDTEHLETLAQSLETQTDPQAIADALHQAASERTHEKAWAWVVLPTFPDQHYGRILLFKVETKDPRYPIIVTQPTFLEGEGTQFHTHGHNVAFATPLGSDRHINTIWLPASETSVFPLLIQERTSYDTSNVVMIPVGKIHGITKALKHLPHRLSLAELKNQGQAAIEQVVRSARFGEALCLHVYMPNWEAVTELANTYYVKNDPKFFEKNDMIVFNTRTKKVWTGGGGAFPLRALEAATTGDHCGACFIENDPSQEDLDQEVIARDYIRREPRPVVFQY
jgi:hypothetical protein